MKCVICNKESMYDYICTKCLKDLKIRKPQIPDRTIKEDRTFIMQAIDTDEE